MKYLKYLLIAYLLCVLAIKGLGDDNRTHIAVIDSGIDLTNQDYHKYLCEFGHVDLTGSGMQDSVDNKHGTYISEILMQYLDSSKECIVMIKVYEPNKHASYVNGLRYAYNNHYHYVNMSAGGSRPDKQEKSIISDILNHGDYVFVSSGNSGLNLNDSCSYYPACYSGDLKDSKFHIVGGLEVFANRGSIVTDLDSCRYKGLSGTSFSTPRALGKFIQKLRK